MSLFRIVDQDAARYSNIYLFCTIFVHIAGGKTGTSTGIAVFPMKKKEGRPPAAATGRDGLTDIV